MRLALNKIYLFKIQLLKNLVRVVIIAVVFFEISIHFTIERNLGKSVQWSSALFDWVFWIFGFFFQTKTFCEVRLYFAFCTCGLPASRRVWNTTSVLSLCWVFVEQVRAGFNRFFVLVWFSMGHSWNGLQCWWSWIQRVWRKRRSKMGPHD